ncbi:hypothetical protein GCM10027048_42060 [Hymenobacter coalescens]
MSRPAAAPSYRFFLALGLALLAIISLLLALIYLPTSYADVDALRQLRYHDGTFRYLHLPLTPTRYFWARAGLLTLMLGSAALLAWQWHRGAGWYAELAALRREWRTAPSLLAGWRRLRPAERGAALGLLTLLLLVRAYYLLYYPLYGDEVVSYQCFVRPGIVAATGFYPIPNNHICYSVLSWLFSQLSPNIHWAMRAPTFLISGVGTVLVGLLLLRHMGFRVATLTVLLYGFFPYALFQSVVGRGYFLLAVCGQIGFVAALALLRGTQRPRLTWAVLLTTSVVGLYAMPTYLLIVAGLYGALGLHAAFHRRRAAWLPLVLSGVLTGLLTLLVYAPVLVVSGPGTLFGNAYVAPGAGRAAGLTALAFVQRTEGQLLGVERLGALPALGLSLALLVATDRLPAARRLRPLVLPVLALLWLPYAVLLARQVFPPVRVLSYRMFFLLLPAAALFDLFLRRWRPLRTLNVGLTVALPVLLWAGAALLPFQRRAALEAQRNARVAEAYRWLRGQQAHRVLADHAHYQVYLLEYGRADRWLLRVDAAPVPGVTYEYSLVDKDGPGAAKSAGRAVFENADVRVYRLRR